MPETTDFEMSEGVEFNTDSFDLDMSAYDTSMYGDTSMYMYSDIFGGAFIVIIILSLIIHLLTAWGIFNIAKAQKIEYPWIAWIPLAQYYTIMKIAGKPGWWVLIMLLPIIPFVGIIAFIVLYIMVLHEISKRCGRGGGTTALLFFFYFIMFPILGNEMKAKAESGNLNVGSPTGNTGNKDY